MYFSFIHLRDVRAPVILSSFDSVDSAPSLKKLRYVFCIYVTYFVTGRVGVRHTLVSVNPWVLALGPGFGPGWSSVGYVIFVSQ